MTVADQARAFAAMALCGAGTGLLHDLLAALGKRTLLAAGLDLLLGVICAAGVICTGLVLRCDPLGLYTPLGIGAGWIIYAASLGTIVRVFQRFAGELLKKVMFCVKNRRIMQEKEKTRRI